MWTTYLLLACIHYDMVEIFGEDSAIRRYKQMIYNI